MKKLKFSKPWDELILSGQKHTTWRINDEKNIKVGDELSLCHTDGREFAKAQVIFVREAAFGALSDEDREGLGHNFASAEDMYSTFSKYYGMKVSPETGVKVIKFKLVSKPIDGLLILDKPAGPTSREVVERVKKMLGVKSAGHVGTLDPGATGVLPILLGRATRAARAFDRSDKEYAAVVQLHKDVSDAELQVVLKRFVGTIKQLPPVKSAVVRRVRERHVYSIGILGREGRDVRLRVVCEAGTYVRKLVSDIGSEIGGAHLKGLRRTRSGTFGVEQAHTMEELQNALGGSSNTSLRRIILPIEQAVAHIPNVVVKDSTIPAIMHGSPVSGSGIVKASSDMKKGAFVAILSTGGELLALGYAVAEDITKRSVVIVQVDRVVKTIKQ